MNIYPAIDIKGGKCVRLTQGEFDREQVYFDRPADVAALWKQKGVSMLHVVDLDGALEGSRINQEAIAKIGKELPFQLGGGIRTLEDVEAALNLGACRVIIGTAAVKRPAFVQEAVTAYGDKIAVSLDAKGGYLATDGWTKVLPQTAVDFAREMETMGLSTMIYTDIARDGMLKGPNWSELMTMKQAVNMNVIASGGISSLEDVKRVEAMGLYGCIVGKALYEGKINVEDLV